MRALRSAVLICLAIYLGTGVAAAQQTGQPDGKIPVTLLGAGTPPPFLSRFGAATLVQAGGQTLLFDCGRGTTQRLWQKRVPLGAVDHLFLTHLHSDHVVGIPDLWLTGWLTSPFGRRPGPFNVYGPAGTAAMMANLEEAFAWDVATRLEDQKLPEQGVAVAATEIAEGVVYDRDGVTVTAFEVDHGDLIQPAFGFRVDYDDRSVVISGDTRYSENLVRHAQGADLLIHSVAAIRQELLDSAVSWQRIMDHHSEPEDAGRVFAQVRPRMAAYTHVVRLTYGTIPPVGEDEMVARTRTVYDGPLTMGKDLMSFAVTEEAVTVLEP